MSIIKIKDNKIMGYLIDKGSLIDRGRIVSQEIEKIEAEIEEQNTKEREITNSIEPTELIAKGNALQTKINEMINELEKIGDEIMKTKLAAIPEDMMAKHKELRTKKEEKERERNKIALKVQKIKDRLAPLVKNVVKPHLKEYEDTETVEAHEGAIVIKTFSYLDEWKAKFKKRNG